MCFSYLHKVIRRQQMSPCDCVWSSIFNLTMLRRFFFSCKNKIKQQLKVLWMSGRMLTLTAAVAQLRVTHLRHRWLDNLSRKCVLFTWATRWNYCVLLDSAIFHAMLQQLQCCCCFLQTACSTSQRPSHAETTFVDMGVRTIWEGNKCLTSSCFDAKYLKSFAKKSQQFCACVWMMNSCRCSRFFLLWTIFSHRRFSFCCCCFCCC